MVRCSAAGYTKSPTRGRTSTKSGMTTWEWQSRSSCRVGVVPPWARSAHSSMRWAPPAAAASDAFSDSTAASMRIVTSKKGWPASDWTAMVSALRAALASRYRLEKEIGRGGMATVWLAWDLKHERPVALKVLHPELASLFGPERFQREIRLAGRLQHPHILPVFDSGESAGRLWFTMPYVEGQSLRDRLTRD